jgi:O-antigen ligase
LGALGVGAFLVTFIGALYRTFARVRVGAIDTGLWPLLFLTLFVVFSFSESSILRHNDLTWVIYVATIAAYGFRPVSAPIGTPRYAGMAHAARPGQGWSAWRS